MKKVCFIIWLAMACTVIYAQTAPIVQLGIEAGLSNDYVVDITQDKDGFLWFATEEGLNKFDGTRFISYYKHTSSISGNELNSVYADPSEPVVWVATQRDGLNAFNYERNTLKVYLHDPESPASLATNDVTAIAAAADGNLWLSTYHRGVEYFDKKTEEFTHYNTSTLTGLICDNVWSILDDGKGSLYIGHVDRGMSVLSVKSKQVKAYRHDPDNKESLPGNDVRCIYKDRSDNIWVGTNNGLALFDTETGSFVKLDGVEGSILSSAVFDMWQTDDHKLWVATELNGLVVVDLRQRLLASQDSLHVVHYTVGYNKYSISNPTVRSVFQDSFNNIWLGTYGGGVNFIGHTQPLFDSYGFSPIPGDVNSLNNRVALSLCIDKDERLWIGTDGSGINVFEKGKRVAVYDKENSQIGHNTIQTAFTDSNGNLWFGAFWGGVSFYDYAAKRFVRIVLNGESNHDVRCFLEDADGNIWIGTNDGAFVADPDTRQVLRHYTREEYMLPEDLVRALAQDRDKRIWIGSFGLGLAVFSPDMQHLETFSEYNGFSSNTINYIFTDSRGRVWVATGEGLVCFTDPGSFAYKVFGREEGLNNTYIRAITEDNNGNIWFSTNAGISCFFAETEAFRNYNYFDKIPMGSFTSNVVKNAEGIIYFGSNNGVRYFDPVSVLSYRPVPPVVITEMNIYETRKSERKKNFFNGKIKLNHRQNTFSIKFNIQDFSLANQVDYAYMLEGLDETWHTTVENNVMYRNIPPGNYTFHVRTRIRNQAWAEDTTRMAIAVIPPLWLSWWAKIIYFVFIAFLVIYLLRAYKKKVELRSSYELEKKNHIQEQELNQERLRFYTNIAHELRTPLTLILGPLEDLQKDTQLLPKQSQKISVVRQSALRLLNLINQILEFRKTETQNKKLCVSKGNLATLVREIGLKYKELNTKPDIRFVINIGSDPMSIYFDKEIVHIVLDNLISNALKYTEKGQITLSLYTVVRDDISYTEIKVDDTGYGILPEEQDRIFDRYFQAKSSRQASGTGIGLALVKNLVTLHEGQIRVESQPGKGSSFIFSLLTHNIYTNALHSDVEEEKTIPRETEKEQPEEPMPEGKPILLVVEDNADIRHYIQESLADSYEVVTANEGAEGYNAALAHTPDIIVSDVMMPGVDGIAFLRKVKEDVRTSHIPVILLTAKDTLQDKEEGYVYGADSYLTKPFSASLLHSRIHNLLENRKKMAALFGKSMHVEDKSALFKESLNRLDNEFIRHITELIEENLESEMINITYLSNKLSMSSSTLFRKMKALTGISTNEFIRKIKMKNAERLLLTGKYNISEVAYKIGMNSPVYFRQCFKEEFGVSPSEYLRKLDG